jgi:hypothetical protein
MARDGHGLPKVSPGLPYLTLLYPVGRPPLVHSCEPPLEWSGEARGGQGWPAHRTGGRQPAAVFYPFGHPTPYAYGFQPSDLSREAVVFALLVPSLDPGDGTEALGVGSRIRRILTDLMF